MGQQYSNRELSSNLIFRAAAHTSILKERCHASQRSTNLPSSLAKTTAVLDKTSMEATVGRRAHTLIVTSSYGEARRSTCTTYVSASRASEYTPAGPLRR